MENKEKHIAINISDVCSSESNFKKYLHTILQDNEVSALLDAIHAIRNGGDTRMIVVGGPELPTGKSTLVSVLNAIGIPSVEDYQIYRVDLTKTL